MRQLNILEYKERQKASGKARAGRWGNTFFPLYCLLSVICCSLLLVSCAPQVRHAGPDFGGMSLDDALTQYKKISSIKSVIGIEYEKNDATMSGDGALFVSPDKLSLRIYYLGFLQGEIYQDKGVVKSNPKIDRNKSALLVNGLKSSLLWWNISDYTRTETEDSYELSNYYRKVVIDKNSLMPTEQTLVLDNGDLLTITYGRPEPRLAEDGKQLDIKSPLGWYPGRLKIQLGRYVVRVGVKSYEITR
jgi:hypothetical protein